MQSLKSAISFAFSRSPSKNLQQKPKIDVQLPQTRRFSEPNGVVDSVDSSNRRIPGNIAVESVPEAMPNLFERSIKVLFPNFGNADDHERSLQLALKNINGIVNVCTIKFYSHCNFVCNLDWN